MFYVLMRFNNPGHPQGLISLNQGRNFFEVYMDSIKNFKNKYYYVAPINLTAHESLYKIPTRALDEEDRVSCG